MGDVFVTVQFAVFPLEQVHRRSQLSDQWHAGEEDACCKCPTTAHDEC